jgi:hypothetical protein
MPLKKISNKEAIPDKEDDSVAWDDPLTDYSDDGMVGKKRKRKGKKKGSKQDDDGYIPPKAKKAKTTPAIEASLTTVHNNDKEEPVNSIQQSLEKTATPPEITQPGEPSAESVPGEHSSSEDDLEDSGGFLKDYGTGLADYAD